MRSPGPLRSLGDGQLAAHLGAVVGPLDGAEHADRRGLVRPARQPRELEGEALVRSRRARGWRRLADVGHLDDAQLAVGAHDHRVLEVGAEADRLAVHQRDQHLVALVLGR